MSNFILFSELPEQLFLSANLKVIYGQMPFQRQLFLHAVSGNGKSCSSQFPKNPRQHLHIACSAQNPKIFKSWWHNIEKSIWNQRMFVFFFDEWLKGFIFKMVVDLFSVSLSVHHVVRQTLQQSFNAVTDRWSDRLNTDRQVLWYRFSLISHYWFWHNADSLLEPTSVHWF